MTPYGFFFDQSRCIGCNACVISCKQWHNIPPGPVKWMRVYQWEKGAFPDLRLHLLAIPCYHCENPVCIKACPHRAIIKEKKYGAVLVDDKKCRGSRKCWNACPYGAPQYEGDGPGYTMSKCTMCFDRLEEGLKPICVLSCSMRALEFGPLVELRGKYGQLRQLQDMPDGSVTRPAVIFRSISPKKQVISWNPGKVLELWQKRDLDHGLSLPDVFLSKSDVAEARQDIVGRNKLMLKAKSCDEMMYYTTDDE
jgi:anaerobic dimethyl sulfoxide reductase subunit B (iron-sulfur subunit)